MKPRTKVSIAIGCLVLAVAGVSLPAFLRQQDQADVRAALSKRYATAAQETEFPHVLLWGEASTDHWKVRRALRLEILKGSVIHNGTLVTLEDLPAYIDREAKKIDADYVMLNPSNEEKFGDLVSIIDRCRKCHLRLVLLNQFGS